MAIGERLVNDRVLDASVVLAFLNDEKGSEKLKKIIPGAMISSVNFSEVVGKLLENGVPETAAREALDTLSLNIIDFDEALAFEAGKLRPKTKRLGLSLGDRACLATASSLKLTALTLDRSWLKLRTKHKIEYAR